MSQLFEITIEDIRPASHFICPAPIPTDPLERALNRKAALEPISILVVDDDPTTQAIIAAFAAELGHTVIPSESGTEALTILESEQGVDVVIAESSLPGMTGPEVISRSRSRLGRRLAAGNKIDASK